ncbi:DNA polymerase III subunit gamma/tau [Sphaerospermopsis sp. LEGE 08334]|uniref:DNA polymerase III subunit gamma/tau n=1 Tax=Sphaerospermopsis sp. LEGE 08334 TaxID=1828651 RepID=UPI00188309C7|nr:DNA polymerase III subunit gamma/tau [Sphaerospermopsis sp. LEGE 08334]MBE9059209.1 DNA polymerase III subunit gamma/tau [Sphaerospermopsis sp. LEGE 08334]
MPYEPLHHKYRPKSFAELVGQEAIATTLTNAINSAKIAPAYLFTGPRGTGKTSSARILAKSLNCLKSNNPTAEPCGVCDICQGITKGYSLDVIEIDAASNTGVDNIRELIEKAQFAPVQCRYKVYVIDECHMLSTAAFNALLKTLEEPPKHVVFILATTDPQRVLPTIISRCQRFDFRRIQLEAMVRHLSKIAANESINLSQDAITLVAQLSQGGLRDAESLLDQLALLPGEVSPDQVWDLVGSVSEKDLLVLLEAIAQDNSEIVLDSTRKILDRGREPLIILQNLAAFYRDLLIAKTAPTRQDLVACTQQTWNLLVNFAHRLDITTILRGQQHLRTAEVQLKNTTQPRLWLEVTLLGLLPSANIQVQAPSIPQAANTSAVSAPPPAYTQPNYHSPVSAPAPAYHQPNQNSAPNTVSTPASTPAPTYNQPNYHNSPPHTISTPAAEPVYTPPAPETTPTAPPQEVVAGSEYDLNQIWHQVRNNIQQLPPRTLLGQMCQLIELNDVIARVAVQPKWYDKVKSYLPIITTAFHHTFQRDIQVSLEKATSSTSATAKRNSPPQDSTSVQQLPTTPIYNQPQPTSQPAPPPPPTPKIEPVVTNTASVDNSAPPPTPAPISPAPVSPAPISPTPISPTPISPTPISPAPVSPAPVSTWNTEQVAKAAKSLAEFFRGEIISLTDDVLDLSDTRVSPDVEIYETDYDYD